MLHEGAQHTFQLRKGEPAQAHLIDQRSHGVPMRLVLYPGDPFVLGRDNPQPAVLPRELCTRVLRRRLEPLGGREAYPGRHDGDLLALHVGDGVAMTTCTGRFLAQRDPQRHHGPRMSYRTRETGT
jgi:hypothetical protein